MLEPAPEMSTTMRPATRLPYPPMIWDEPVRGGYFDPAILGLSGLEQLRSFRNPGAQAPPLSRLTGQRPIAFEDGLAIFEMPTSPWLASVLGVISGGAQALLADASLGCAIQTKLGPATPYTTAELSITSLRPVPTDGRHLRATGRAIHVGRSLALSDVTVEDADGRLVAHGTSRCHVFPQLEPVPSTPEPTDPTPAPPTYDTPDPWERPVEGGVVTAEEIWSRPGLETLRAYIAGELPAPPISYLTGIRPSAVEEGSAEVTVPVHEWLASPTGYVQGGVTALVCETALAVAIHTTLGAGTSYAMVDLKVNYLRPLPPDGRLLKAQATVAHRGKSLAIANTEVLNADGKRVAVATGSAQLRGSLPGA